MLGMCFGALLGGSILIESIFSCAGMGRYAVKAITFLDFRGYGVTDVIAFYLSLSIYWWTFFTIFSIHAFVTIKQETLCGNNSNGSL